MTRRPLIATLAAIALGLVTATTAWAATVPVDATEHFGPYASGSPDSGTCGNDWADDTFARHFTVSNSGGSITVVEEFKDGAFTTPSKSPSAWPKSPGACQSGSYNGGVVRPGITGSMHGYFVIPLKSGQTQTSTDPHCNALTKTNAGCTTGTFINTHFACAYLATCTVTTFLFHYAAGSQSLIQHEWKNASADRGGNSGDIRSS